MAEQKIRLPKRKVNTKIFKSLKQTKKPTVRKNPKNKQENVTTEINPPPESFLKWQERPQLLLQQLYFLSCAGSKHVSIGFAPDFDFKPMIILTSGYSHVHFSVTDWLAMFHLDPIVPIENWLGGQDTWMSNTDCITPSSDDMLMMSKNIQVVKYIVNGKKYIHIENIPKKHTNRGALMDYNEYNQCLQLDSYFQPLIKQMQCNSALIEDYYELYTYYCITKAKSCLDDSEYFEQFGNTINFDTFRIFKEIPLVCKERLTKDLSLIRSSV